MSTIVSPSRASDDRRFGDRALWGKKPTRIMLQGLMKYLFTPEAHDLGDRPWGGGGAIASGTLRDRPWGEGELTPGLRRHGLKPVAT